MAKAVKPGGWLLVEEPDFTIESIAPGIDEGLIRLWTHGMRVVGLVQRQRGMDVTLGQRLFSMVRDLGFTSLTSDGQTRMFRGGLARCGSLSTDHGATLCPLCGHGRNQCA